MNERGDHRRVPAVEAGDDDARGELQHARRALAAMERELAEHRRLVAALAGREALLRHELATEARAQRSLEEQYLQAQKMEAVGRLAGGMAHDFNNLLGVILGYAELLLSETAEEDPRYEQIGEIRRAAERGAKLARLLLAFSRKQPIESRTLDLNTLLADTGRMVRRLVGGEISFRYLPGAGPAWVLADPGQIDQIVMNLAVNARDAMPGGGTLVLETGNAGPEQSVPPNRQPGDWVTFTVKDDGVGMSDEVKEHLFEPFFTTKEPGKGTGLGLATVYGIVGHSGGFLRVESAPGQGTAIRVFLPASSPAEAGKRMSGVFVVDVPLGTETVLVVEDDEAVRVLLRELTQQLGYTVLTAASDPDALEAAGRHEGELHLLLCEMEKEGMAGRELLRRLQEKRPETRALFMLSVAEGSTLPEGGVFIPKPIRRESLARKLREALRQM